MPLLSRARVEAPNTGCTRFRPQLTPLRLRFFQVVPGQGGAVGELAAAARRSQLISPLSMSLRCERMFSQRCSHQRRTCPRRNHRLSSRTPCCSASARSSTFGVPHTKLQQRCRACSWAGVHVEVRRACPVREELAAGLTAAQGYGAPLRLWGARTSETFASLSKHRVGKSSLYVLD